MNDLFGRPWLHIQESLHICAPKSHVTVGSKISEVHTVVATGSKYIFLRDSRFIDL